MEQYKDSKNINKYINKSKERLSAAASNSDYNRIMKEIFKSWKKNENKNNYMDILSNKEQCA